MKVVQKKGEDGLIELDCTASTGDVSYVMNAMHRQFCNQMGVRVPEGKTIAECVEAQLGIKDLDKVVEPQAIEALVPMALDKRGIVAAFKPTPEPKSALKRGKTFSFVLKVTPKPEFELTSYDPVSITVNPAPDCTEEVNAQLAALAEQYCQYVADDPHPVAKGNDIKIAMNCSVDGKEIKNLCFESRSYTVGLGYMPETFDENVLGMDVGETKEFSFEAPDIDEKGNEITTVVDAKVTVIEIQKRVAPVIDEEWLKAYMPMYRSVDELKENIEKTVSKQKMAEYNQYVRDIAAEAMSNRFEGTIADEVYEGVLQVLSQNLHQEIGGQNMTWDDFVEQNGGEQNLNMMMMMQTRTVLRQGYTLDAVFRHEGLVITDEDLDDICSQINPKNPKLARKQLEESGNGQSLRESAERLRANKWIVEHADITVREEAAPIDAGGATAVV